MIDNIITELLPSFFAFLLLASFSFIGAFFVWLAKDRREGYWEVWRSKTMFYGYLGFMIVAVIIGSIQNNCNENKPFTKSNWKQESDGFYLSRESIVDDLMESHLYKRMTVEDVILLLGEPENFSQLDNSQFGYEIMVDFGWDIDPVEEKRLIFTIQEDSSIEKFELVHIEH